MLFGVPVLVPSAYGLLGLVVLALLRGDLVPRRVVRDLRKDHSERIAQEHAVAEMWRNAYESERDANNQHLSTAQLSIETARTATAVARAVSAPAVEGDPDANAVA